MTVDIVALIANTGGTLGLAIFAIWMLNKTWRDRMDEEKRNTDLAKTMWTCTREALEKNTEALTKLVERMERNDRRQ